MQVAIFDYMLGQITVFDVPDEELTLDYVESLPGFDSSWCMYMTSKEPINIRVGSQADFPEFRPLSHE